MRQFKLRILVLVAAVAVLFGFPLLAPTPHHIDQAHFEMIQNSMTKAEVEAVFGVPPGQYDWAEPEPMYARHVWFLMAMRLAESEHTATTSVGHDRRLVRLMRSEPTISETWASRHGVFTVHFDSDHRVVVKNGARGVRIVPPWQRWWKAIWER
jgi:hypothetical protein